MDGDVEPRRLRLHISDRFASRGHESCVDYASVEPHEQLSQVHGSHVQFGFSQVLVSAMAFPYQR